jgi:hydroxymethylpyrimidine pyrophosphatase-like HAD family hydrolase
MNRIVAVDFDGTVVTHEYPEVGTEVAGAVSVLKKLQASDTKIILWTMRSDDELEDAVRWFAEREIDLFGINMNPEQIEWTNSPKAYAQLYIDDAAAGCPVKASFDGGRDFVDWYEVETILNVKGFIRV